MNRQHGVVSRDQLLALGFSEHAIWHRLKRGSLHPVRRGIYAVGRPELTSDGQWMAAVLACGPTAVLSHESAAALWGIDAGTMDVIDVSVPAGIDRRPAGLAVHRRTALCPNDMTRHRAIPVTTPTCTLVDLAARVERSRLERAINEADKRNLTNPESLRATIVSMPRRPGIAVLRAVLDRDTFALTDSELERRFLPIARRAGLPQPRTGAYVNGFKVDFYWPELGLVVETDGLRYHRTPDAQARDRRRDQAHAAAGITALRFTHAQVTRQPNHVEHTLAAVVRRIRQRGELQSLGG